jgi:hypothetical protein
MGHGGKGSRKLKAGHGPNTANSAGVCRRNMIPPLWDNTKLLWAPLYVHFQSPEIQVFGLSMARRLLRPATKPSTSPAPMNLLLEHATKAKSGNSMSHFLSFHVQVRAAPLNRGPPSPVFVINLERVPKKPLGYIRGRLSAVFNSHSAPRYSRHTHL